MTVDPLDTHWCGVLLLLSLKLGHVEITRITRISLCNGGVMGRYSTFSTGLMPSCWILFMSWVICLHWVLLVKWFVALFTPA